MTTAMAARLVARYKMSQDLALQYKKILELPILGKAQRELGPRKSFAAPEKPSSLKSPQIAMPYVSPNISREMMILRDLITTPSFIVSPTTYLTKAQEDKVEELVLSVQPEAPMYVTTMTKSSVAAKSSFLRIGSDFAEHLPHKKQLIKLLRPKERRECKATFSHGNGDTHSRSLRGRPWRRFVRRNGIQQDDICLFQVMKKMNYWKNMNKGGTYAMTVHILRKESFVA